MLINNFTRVIVDEVHKAGNRANELAEALRILHPRKLVLMTGTPILNDACAELSSYFEIMKIHPWADQSILHDVSLVCLLPSRYYHVDFVRPFSLKTELLTYAVNPLPDCYSCT